MTERISESVLAAGLGAVPLRMVPLAGGDVARAYRVELADGRTVFAKTHDNPPPHFFTTEAAGLGLLRGPDVVRVPEVLLVSDEPPLLVLEWIDETRATPSDEAGFGRALAALHATGLPSFGREDRRSTGSRGLPNDPSGTWAEFYATRRLLPLARLARDGGALDAGAIVALEDVAERIGELAGPSEPPALLHGDLWAGNRLVDAHGASWLIDPATFGGHREFDLAMMRLFGGFGEACFDTYNEAAPLAAGWPERIPLMQLAPLVVHAIKFGGAYVGAVEAALAQLR